MYISYFTVLLMYASSVCVTEDYVDGFFEPGYVPF